MNKPERQYPVNMIDIHTVKREGIRILLHEVEIFSQNNRHVKIYCIQRAWKFLFFVLLIPNIQSINIELLIGH